MKSAVADMIFLLVGLLAGITLVTFIAILGTESHQLGSDLEDRRAMNVQMNMVAEAQPFVDIEREISGDDLVEFLTDNGGLYNYEILLNYNGERSDRLKDISTKEVTKGSNKYIQIDIKEGSKAYEHASETVKKNLKGYTSGDLEAYASTALWSQFYLAEVVLNDALPSRFKPIILVNNSGSSDTSNWTEYKDTNKQLKYTLVDVLGGDKEFVIVYQEV